MKSFAVSFFVISASSFISTGQVAAQTNAKKVCSYTTCVETCLKNGGMGRNSTRSCGGSCSKRGCQ
jgi:hypothetical protein